MPMPKPRKSEQRDKFVKRFMRNKTMVKDFPDEEQRLAVAYDTWERAMKENAAAVMEEVEIDRIKHNADPALIREDRLENRDVWVVPMVMITEGVHNGSQGPIYYPGDELARYARAWDGKPVVVYHPEMTANSKEIYDKRKIGVIMNTTFDKVGRRLTAEAWIFKDAASRVDSRVSAAIMNRSIMELSTGLFTDDILTPGTWNGRPYEKIAVNHRPDHLAILPDQRGACSIADGAGFIRNEGEGIDEANADKHDMGEEAERGGELTANNTEQEGVHRMEREAMIEALVANGCNEEILGAMEDVEIEHFHGVVVKNEEEPPAEDVVEESEEVAAEEAVKEDPAEDVAPVENAAPVTFEAVLNSAPLEIRESIEQGVALYAERKAELVGKIVANERNTFSEEALNAKPFAELEMIANLAGGGSIQIGRVAPAAPKASVEQAMGIRR